MKMTTDEAREALLAWLAGDGDTFRTTEYIDALPATPPASADVEAASYEDWVDRVADAIHETCRNEWRAITLVDPKRMVTQHGTDAHYGMAHDLVRRLGLAAIRAEGLDERAFWLALDTLVASDPQKGYSRERQRGWDEAIASVRAIARLAKEAER